MLPKKTLLLEEGSCAKEIVIIVKGNVEIYRRLPHHTVPAVIADQNINTEANGENETPKEEGEDFLPEMSRGHFKFTPISTPPSDSQRLARQKKRRQRGMSEAEVAESDMFENLNKKYPFVKGCEQKLD